MNGPSAFPQKAKGFSLLELLAVIVIVVILLGVTGISFFQYSSDVADVRRGQRLVASMVDAARGEARASRCGVSLILKETGDKSCLTIAKMDGDGAWQPIKRWLTLPTMVESRYSSQDYPNTFQEGDARLEFDADGEVVSAEVGVYIFLPRKGVVMETDDDATGCRWVYVSKLTGKSILN